MHLDRLPVLLRERRNKGLPVPCLQFPSQEYAELSDCVALPVMDLLAAWPDTVPELIERSLCNLIYYGGGPAEIGGVVKLPKPAANDFLFFTDDPTQESYLIRALLDYEWVQNEGSSDEWRLIVTPMGWAKFDEITRARGDIHNFVFVAMWFGKSKPDQSHKMDALWNSTIKPACESLGWLVKRADTDEHNDPIMDRVIADIRVAPYVIAELTENNPGVYYEAGFARGFGKEVIYCCPEGQRVHFDLTGVNQVRWKDPDDLCKRLSDRILGTVGTGPHEL